MNTKSFTLLISLIACVILGCASAQAQDKPEWVKQDVSALNAKRYNDTYEFVKLHNYSADRGYTRYEAKHALREYVMGVCGAESNQVSIEPVDGANIYQITVETPQGVETLEARLVDQYEVFDEFDENSYEYNMYQLYAVSKPNVAPEFDDIKVKSSNNASTALLTLIPGAAQLYKHQDTKGWCILGGEVVLISTSIALEAKRRDYKRHLDNGEPVQDSWRSKVQSMRVMRNVGIGLAAGLYVYNLIDGWTSKGPNRIVVDRAKGQNVTFTPVVYEEGAGVGLVYTF